MPKLHFEFFPEGGNVIAGLSNTIAFKVTDENGFPATLSGNIKDSKGNIITTLHIIHDGMGIFTIRPEAGEKYTAETISGHRFPLPDATTYGIAMQVTHTPDTIVYTLQSPAASATLAPALLVGQMQHNIVFRHRFTANNNNITTGHIPTVNLPSGVLQITVFNKDTMPLAERLVFIDNKEYMIPANMETEIVNNGYRKFNNYSITLPDSVTGNFSISVTDADYDNQGVRSHTIISSFLLTSDIAGYVHHPAWYFSSAENTRQALDLVMMCNKWKRFKWSDAISDRLPAPLHQDKGYISLSGRATLQDSKKSFADKDLMVWVGTADSAQSLQLVKTDAQGRFKMDSMIFFDKAKVLFTDVMGNKSKFITVELDADSLYTTYSLPPLHIPYMPLGGTPDAFAQKMNSAYFDYGRGEGLMLDNVFVKGNKTRQQRLEELYMSGLFAGGIHARTYDLTREFIPQWNIFEYLQGRVPGLSIERGNGIMSDYRLYYRQAGARRQMQVYLDEMLMPDASIVSTIPAHEIAMVKVFPTFVGAPGGGANGVIAIYTKKGLDMDEYTERTGDIVGYNGYSIMKEFYAPDYSKKAANPYTDYRLTLYWNPEIFISGKNRKIPVSFYNNDRTRRFKIVAEGITADGKLLMVEKIVAPGQQ